MRIEVFKLTERSQFARDLKLHSQTEDAANSICRNIAEGFGCESHVEFARFLEISNRSLNELIDSLRAAELKRYVSAVDVAPVRSLATRLYPALRNLMAYLRRTPNRRPRTDRRR
jgi:four helix bundle protein